LGSLLLILAAVHRPRPIHPGTLGRIIGSAPSARAGSLAQAGVHARLLGDVCGPAPGGCFWSPPPALGQRHREGMSGGHTAPGNRAAPTETLSARLDRLLLELDLRSSQFNGVRQLSNQVSSRGSPPGFERRRWSAADRFHGQVESCAAQRRLRQLGWIVGTVDGVEIHHTKKTARGSPAGPPSCGWPPHQLPSTAKAPLVNPGENPGANQLRLGVAAVGISGRFEATVQIPSPARAFRCGSGSLPYWWQGAGSSRAPPPPTACRRRGWRGRLGRLGRANGSGGGFRSPERTIPPPFSTLHRALTTPSPRPSLRPSSAAHCWLPGTVRRSPALARCWRADSIELAQLQAIGATGGSRNQGPAQGCALECLWDRWQPFVPLSSGGSGKPTGPPLLPSRPPLSSRPCRHPTATRSRRPFAELLKRAAPREARALSCRLRFWRQRLSQ